MHERREIKIITKKDNKRMRERERKKTHTKIVLVKKVNQKVLRNLQLVTAQYGEKRLVCILS